MFHQLALSAKQISVDNIIDFVVKIVNSIIAKPLQRRLYDVFKEANESDARGLVYYTEVRWLSKGNMLERFFENLNDIIAFFKSIHREYSELQDPEWLSKLAYLVGLTQIVNRRNKEMQGNMKFIWENVRVIRKLKTFLKSAIDDFHQKSVPVEFPRLAPIVKKVGKDSFDFESLAQFSEKFYNDIESRFADIVDTQDINRFLINPLDRDIDLKKICTLIRKLHPVNAAEVMDEIYDLLEDIEIRALIHNRLGFWTVIARENLYPNLLIVYKRIRSFFGTTYLCESGFSHMNHIKSVDRNVSYR